MRCGEPLVEPLVLRVNRALQRLERVAGSQRELIGEADSDAGRLSSMRSQEEMSEARSLDQKAEEEEPSTGVDGEDVEDGPSTEEISLFSGRRIVQTLVVVALLIVAIYFLFPSLVGLEDALAKIDDAKLGWVLVAVGFGFAMFGTYITLFRGVVGGDELPLTWREAYEINMAALAASRLFSAGGAGGIALTYWALRKAGMDARRSTQRMVVFLALQYAFYPLAIIVCGVLLRTGVLSGEELGRADDRSGRDRGRGPGAGPAGGADPGRPRAPDRELVGRATGERRWPAASPAARRRSPTGCARRSTSCGTRATEPWRFSARPGSGRRQIAILWASFRAFGVSVPIGVLVMGFFLGMVANLIPFVPGGVGAVDAGLIGAYVLFGLPEATCFAAVLIYRLVAFWMPLPPGIVAFFQLRGTVHRWEKEGRPIDRLTGAGAGAGPSDRSVTSNTSESEVSFDVRRKRYE